MQWNLCVGVCVLRIGAAGKQKMVAIAQLVRVSDCDSEGRGFEPHWLPKTSPFGRFFYFAYRSYINFNLYTV